MNRGLLMGLGLLSLGACGSMGWQAAQRLLAPWFGLDLWAQVQLGAVLLLFSALGVGLGGWLVDRRPRGLILAHGLAGASLAFMAVPSLRAGLSPLFGEPSLFASPLLAALLLFSLPALAWGYLLPVMLRLSLLWRGDRALGAGLSLTLAAWLGGALIGWVALPLWFLPWLRIDGIFLGWGLLWGGLASWGYLLWAPGRFSKGNLALIFGLGLGLAWSDLSLAGLPLPEGVLLDRQGPEARFRVTASEEDGEAVYRIWRDAALIERLGPLGVAPRWLQRAQRHQHPRRVLLFGPGSLALARQIHEARPQARLDWLAPDPLWAEAAQKVPGLDWLQVETQDPRLWLAQSRLGYDWVVFAQGPVPPAGWSSMEFLERLKSRLHPGGLFLARLEQHRGAPLAWAWEASLVGVFSAVHRFEEAGAQVWLASPEPVLDLGPRPGGQAAWARSGVRPLTDQWAPVAWLAAQPSEAW